MKRHGKHAQDKEILSIVLASSLKQELRERARARRRVLSDYVRIILEDAVGPLCRKNVISKAAR